MIPRLPRRRVLAELLDLRLRRRVYLTARVVRGALVRDPIRIFQYIFNYSRRGQPHAAGQQVQCGVNQIRRGSSPHCFWTRLGWTNKELSFFDVLLLYSLPFVTPTAPRLFAYPPSFIIATLSPIMRSLRARTTDYPPRCKVCRGPVRFASFDSRGGCYWRRTLFVGLRNRDGVIRVAGREREPVWQLADPGRDCFSRTGEGGFKKGFIEGKDGACGTLRWHVGHGGRREYG